VTYEFQTFTFTFTLIRANPSIETPQVLKSFFLWKFLISNPCVQDQAFPLPFFFFYFPPAREKPGNVGFSVPHLQIRIRSGYLGGTRRSLPAGKREWVPPILVPKSHPPPDALTFFLGHPDRISTSDSIE